MTLQDAYLEMKVYADEHPIGMFAGRPPEQFYRTLSVAETEGVPVRVGFCMTQHGRTSAYQLYISGVPDGKPVNTGAAYAIRNTFLPTGTKLSDETDFTEHRFLDTFPAPFEPIIPEPPK